MTRVGDHRSTNCWRRGAASSKSATLRLTDCEPFPAERRSPSEQLLFNLLLNRPKPLFGAGCSVSPVLNLPRHLLRSVFGRPEFHGKLVCKTHGPIPVFFRQVGGRSDFRNDSLPRVVKGDSIAPSLFPRCK